MTELKKNSKFGKLEIFWDMENFECHLSNLLYSFANYCGIFCKYSVILDKPFLYHSNISHVNFTKIFYSAFGAFFAKFALFNRLRCNSKNHTIKIIMTKIIKFTWWNRNPRIGLRVKKPDMWKNSGYSSATWAVVKTEEKFKSSMNTSCIF